MGSDSVALGEAWDSAVLTSTDQLTGAVMLWVHIPHFECTKSWVLNLFIKAEDKNTTSVGL